MKYWRQLYIVNIVFQHAYACHTHKTPTLQSLSICIVSLKLGDSVWVPAFSRLTRLMAMCFWRSVRNLTFSGTGNVNLEFNFGVMGVAHIQSGRMAR